METRDVLSLSLNAPLVGRFDLEAGTASISEPDFGPLLFDPSSGTLPVLILSSSPDSIWQLIQVGSLASDGQYNGGIWLVSREFQIRLTEAPYRAYGEWAADNSLLWFEYSLPEFGAGSRIIHLDETPPRIIDPEGGESIPTPLDPTYYLTAFRLLTKPSSR